MQIQETLSDGLKRSFRVTVPAENINQEALKVLNRLGQTAKIPGFRPGKIPAQVLKQRYGSSALQEALDHTLQHSSHEVLTQHKIRPALKPSVSIESFGENQDLVYTMSLEMLPSIELGKFDDITITRYKAPVSDEMVEERLKEMASMMKNPESITEDRGATKGEVVIIDFEGFVDGAPLKNGSGQNVNLTLGAGRFIPGFEEQLEGVKKGEAYELHVTFPSDYHEKSLAGKPATFKGTLHDICTLKESDLNEEFAKKYGFEKLEELKDSIRKHLETSHDDTSFLKAKRDVLDALAERYTFDIPQTMADLEFDMIWKQLLREAGIEDAANQNTTNEKTLEEALGKPEQEARAEYKAIAERRVRLGLVLAEIGQKNKIEITNEELSHALIQKAREYPGHEREVVDYYRSNEQALATLRAPIFENKAIQWILDQSKVTEKSVSLEELQGMLAEEEDVTPSKKAKAPSKKKSKKETEEHA